MKIFLLTAVWHLCRTLFLAYTYIYRMYMFYECLILNNIRL